MKLWEPLFKELFEQEHCNKATTGFINELKLIFTVPSKKDTIGCNFLKKLRLHLVGVFFYNYKIDDLSIATQSSVPQTIER